MSKPTAVKSSHTPVKYTVTNNTPRRMPGNLDRVRCPLCNKVLLIEDMNKGQCMKCYNTKCIQLYHANCLKESAIQTCIKCGGHVFVHCAHDMPVTDPADILTNILTNNLEKLNIGGKRKNHKKSKKSIKNRRSRKTRKTRKTRK